MNPRSYRSEKEVAKLLQQLSDLPQSKADTTVPPIRNKSTTWNKNTNNNIASHGRVNRTKGK